MPLAKQFLGMTKEHVLCRRGFRDSQNGNRQKEEERLQAAFGKNLLAAGNFYDGESRRQIGAKSKNRALENFAKFVPAFTVTRAFQRNPAPEISKSESGMALPNRRPK